LSEALESLQVRADGTYVDCTFGGGGHSRAILERLGPKGRLIAFDQDADARRNLPADTRVTFVPHNFRHIGRFLKLEGVIAVDGILADLGVSSHQFDAAERGFSTRQDAALDMRMDQRQQRTAATILATYTESQLHKLFEQYGEVTNARTLARKIVAVRTQVPLQTVDGFRQALREIVKGNPHKYFAQVFQALRIEVNDELGALQELLIQAPALLKPGGRIAIISFHSLEDRRVKHFFRSGHFDTPVTDPFRVNEPAHELLVITRKPVLPTEEECRTNPRARSAKLRVAEKTMMV
jgi:16S rRNA (cytosine1402-N4)-methyltransferase